MPHLLLKRAILLLIAASLSATALSQDRESGISPLTAEELEAFLKDPAALFEQIDENPDAAVVQASPVKIPAYVFTSSIRAGVGHSDNFLKKYAELVKSDYLQLEFDAYASWRMAEIEFSSLVFAEATLYDFDLEPSDELMGYVQLDGIVNKGALDYGFTSSLVYGSFIYDSSLTAVSVASGTDIRQVMPEAKIHLGWYPSGKNRVRLGLSVARAEFNLENLDYWEPGTGVELEHIWSTSLITSSSIDVSRQLYDQELVRDAGGDPLAGGILLEVSRIAFNQRVTWKPKQWNWLRAQLDIGIAWEDENQGNYKSMRQAWIRNRMTISNSWGRFSFSARWGEHRYDERQVGLFDQRLHLQTSQSLTIEYSRSLRWGISLLARNQWSALKSRIYQDTYSERRSEILIQWSF